MAWSWQNRSRAFDDHLFYLDFVGALRRLEVQRPSLTDRKRFSLALEEADREDRARWVAAQNARNDADYFAHQKVTILPALTEPSPGGLLRVNGRISTAEPPRNPREPSGQGSGRRPNYDTVHKTKWEPTSSRNERYVKRERTHLDYMP